MEKNITLMDGAVGTSLMSKLSKIERDPVWVFNIRYPDLVKELTLDSVAAGSELVLANTFGANRFSIQHFSDYDPKEIVKAGVRLCREALDDGGHDAIELSLPIGALAKLLQPYGPLTPEECADVYEEQIGAGVEEGVDSITLQTFMDIRMMEIATRVAKQYGLPVYCTMTFEGKNRTMMGNTVQQIIDTLTPYDIQAIGLNCSMTPTEALPVIKEYADKTDLPLMVKPNAGKPKTDENGKKADEYTPEQFAKEMIPLLPYVQYVGGCCGCGPRHIAALKKEIDHMA